MTKWTDGPSRAALALATVLLLIGLLHFVVGDLTRWSESITVWPTVGWLMLVSPRLAIWAHRGQWHDVRLVAAAAIGLVASTTEVVSALVRKGDSDHRRLVVDLRFR